MKAKIWFWHTKNLSELMDKKVKDGLISSRKKIWYVDEAKPKFFHSNIIKPGDLWIFVTLFAFSTGLLAFFGFVYAIMGIVMSFIVSLILSVMKKPVPLYVLKHDYSVPLEREDIKIDSKSNGNYAEVKIPEVSEPKNREEFDKLSVEERNKRTLVNVIFKQMLAPGGLWALINRDTMKKALKSKSPLIDMIFYMGIGGAVGFMASIILFGVDLAVLSGGI